MSPYAGPLAAFASIVFVKSSGLASWTDQIEGGIIGRIDVFTVVAVSSGAFFFAGTVGLLRFRTRLPGFMP
jgi:hypothetical protein